MTDENQVNTSETEGTGEAETVSTVSSQSSDPLDAISDPEELRSKAKGYRAERNALKKKPETPPAQFVTRDTLLRTNTQEAKKRVSEEVRQSWDSLPDYVPSKYRGAETPDDIAKGMTLAHKAFLEENPAKQENPGNALTVDAGLKGGVSAPPAPQTEEDDGWGGRPGPDKWFKKSEK